MEAERLLYPPSMELPAVDDDPRVYLRLDEPSWPEAAAGPAPRSELAARTLNVVLALLLLAIAAPVMILVALAVKLTSRGPVIYTQTRVGLDRRAGLVGTGLGHRLDLLRLPRGAGLLRLR